jgi:uncharacterized protein YbjT (DUF2867 family)
VGARQRLNNARVKQVAWEGRVSGMPAEQIIATGRRTEVLADLTEGGVVVRRADFDDEASLGGTRRRRSGALCRPTLDAVEPAARNSSLPTSTVELGLDLGFWSWA